MTTNTRTAAADKGVKPERLADLANFYLGFDAFLSWLEDTDGQIDAFVKRGEMFARRYMPELEEAIQQHLAPLIERNDAARLKPAFRRSERSGSPTDKARFKAEFLQELFFWLRAHQEVFRNTFSGKSRKSATLLMRLAAEDAPVSLVAQAAASPSVSGLQAPRKWLLAAAERMGAAVSEAEMALSNVESLANLATEVKKVEGQLEGVDPNSEDAAELLAQKAALLAQMDENSEGDKGALQAAAAAAYKPSIGHQTQMGAKLSLNAQQEAAMMASGKKVVAAGAGSGKTRVLAGEVAYRINEQGYDASSICAVSFTRKSSKELIKRVSDYGAIIDGPAASGFGTTHFLAGVTILGGYGKSTKRPKYFGKKQNWAVTTLVALAVKQVSMKGGQGMQAPEPKNLFNGKPISVSQDVLDTPVPDLTTPEMDSKTAELISIIEDGIKFFAYGWPSTWKGGDWGRTSARFLTDMKNRLESGVTPDQWSPRQREYLNKLMGNIQKEFGRSMRVGAIEEEPSVDVPDSDESKAQRKGISKYQYWDQPARQWFNLGLKWEGGGKDGKEGQQFSAAGVKRKIDIWKGMGASPEEVWYAAGAAEGKVEPYSPEAAAYAAYEWLKGSNGEPDFRNTGDMNDLLIDATKTLVQDKKARAALQSRFKVILVDEAQDLNRTQHLLFGMLAGAIDPETMKSKADGSMTADTFSFVGDDKQAIYEFRGAEPDEFIDKSDLGPSAGDFQTLLLDTNYRSGQAIVEAANQLIKHNCVEISTPINTPTGTCLAGELQVGDTVLSYRNGDVSPQTVSEVSPSHWTHGIQIVTEAGHRLAMSPNHRLWASEPLLPEGHSAVYLMYREGMGFRVGVTTMSGRTSRGVDYTKSLGARAAMEWGERMWVLGHYPTSSEALFEETSISLRYSIPQTTFNAGVRGQEQDRIDQIFKDFGRNGMQLLEDRLLSFDMPHWAAQSQRRADRSREVVSLLAHTSRGSTVWLKGNGERPKVHRMLHSYDEAQASAYDLGQKLGLMVVEKLRVADHELRLLTASALMPGMCVPVLHEGSVQVQKIAQVNEIQGAFVDLGIEDTCNFFGDGILSHNSKQIPMTCKANVEAKGDGHITAKSFGDPAEAGNYVADYISDNADAHSTGKVKYGNFGVAVRSNAEAMHYALGMVKRAIPFKSSANPFKSPPIKSMLGWMSMVEGGPSMDRMAFLKAAADSLRMPTSYLGKAFGEKLESQRDPLGWLKSMDPYEEFRSNYAKNVEAWLENVAICFRLHGTEDTPDVVYSHLLANLKSSDGQSFFDGIIENIKGNNDKMAELAAENPDGIPTDEQINEAAEEELVLLDGLMGSKDTVDGVMGYVRELKAVNDRVAAGEDDDKDAVIIGTMHSWKGLEVPKLFMPLVRGKFPRAKLAKNPISGELECMEPDKEDPALHSERRLAYVAITRAEDSCVMMDIANPSKAFEGCPPSQFISESCVQWASEQEAVEPEGKMAADELTYLWNDEYEMEPWMLEGPTDEEADEAKLVFDMESTPIEDTPADDPMLAEWFKTTGEG